MKKGLIALIKQNVIFLDVDGVLNHYKFIAQNKNLSSKSQRNIEEQKVFLLKQIITQTEAKIVLSSSWRKVFDRSLNPLSKEAWELKQALQKYEIQIWDKTDDQLSKVKAIEKWLKSNEEAMNNYIIIDDDYIACPPFLASCQVKTSYYVGLTKKEVKRSIHKLNRTI